MPRSDKIKTIEQRPMVYYRFTYIYAGKYIDVKHTPTIAKHVCIHGEERG